jgi:hypothetical protein
VTYEDRVEAIFTSFDWSRPEEKAVEWWKRTPDCNCPMREQGGWSGSCPSHGARR